MARLPLSDRKLFKPVTAALLVVLLAGVGLGVFIFVMDEPADSPQLHRPFSPVTEPLPKARKMVFIIIDTLRRDRLGVYGYDKPTSPSIDRIAKESMIFDRFYSASSWTGPSFGTIFTGVSPLIHRTGKWLARDEIESGTRRVGAVFLNPLSKAVKTLGEHFEDFETAAFLTNGFLHRKFGYARGIDHFDYDTGELYGSRRARVVTDHALKWLEGNAEKDFIALVHYFDLHTAYEPLPEYKEQFAPGPDPSKMFTYPFAPSLKELVHYKPNQKEIDYAIGLYNGELRHVDDQVGVLVDGMKNLGLLENTWLVITSDHGEEHFDHGFFNHGHRYEDELTRVPLIIRAPGGEWGAGNWIPYSASHVDLLPTFLEWFGKEAPWYLEGESLVPLITGEQQKNRPCYMEFPLAPRREHYAYFDGRYKIIRAAYRDRTYMYDLKKDPKEQKRKGKGHRKFKKLEAAMEKYRSDRLKIVHRLKQTDSFDEAVMPEDIRGALKKLGYID